MSSFSSAPPAPARHGSRTAGRPGYDPEAAESLGADLEADLEADLAADAALSLDAAGIVTEGASEAAVTAAEMAALRRTAANEPGAEPGAEPGIDDRRGAPRQTGTFRALRHRNFQLFVGGQLVSLAGTWMQNVAQGWLVYQISQSELMLGVVGFAAAVPALIMSPWAGVVVDRVPKRKLLVATQTLAMLLAFILAALTFTNTVQVWHVVLLAVGLGFVNAFDAPARQAFVVEMVGKEDLPNAIALNSMTFNAARVVGPAFGGLLLATLGSGWCFLINGLSFLAVIMSLLAMKVSDHVARKGTDSVWGQLKGGVTYALHNAELRGLLVFSFFFSTFGISYMTILPAFVQVQLNADAAAYGLLTSAAGLGAVTGAFLLATYGDRGFRGRWLFSAAMVFPFLLALFAFSRTLPVALALGFVLGLGFMFQFTLLNTLLQTRVVDSMRGRVMSLYTLIIFGFSPIGNLVIGSLSEQIGLTQAIFATAVITLVAGVSVFAWTPQLRRLP